MGRLISRCIIPLYPGRNQIRHFDVHNLICGHRIVIFLRFVRLIGKLKGQGDCIVTAFFQHVLVTEHIAGNRLFHACGRNSQFRRRIRFRISRRDRSECSAVLIHYTHTDFNVLNFGSRCNGYGILCNREHLRGDFKINSFLHRVISVARRYRHEKLILACGNRAYFLARVFLHPFFSEPGNVCLIHRLTIFLDHNLCVPKLFTAIIYCSRVANIAVIYFIDIFFRHRTICSFDLFFSRRAGTFPFCLLIRSRTGRIACRSIIRRDARIISWRIIRSVCFRYFRRAIIQRIIRFRISIGRPGVCALICLALRSLTINRIHSRTLLL